MKVSLSWLREYVDFPGTPEALADLLTTAGIEVKATSTRGVDLDKVVVAQIQAAEQHPNADRLSVCRVDDGSGQPPRQIVCGAKNFRVGDKVPLALPGAVLPGDVRIKVGRLRGVESEGMLCSARELGVSEDAAGLLILPPESAPGTPIGALFPPDTVLEVEITPNRPDLLSHGGLAREVAAFTGARLRWPGPPAGEPGQTAAAAAPAPADSPTVVLEVGVAPDAAAACPYYSARIVDGVRVGPSPAWLRQRLEAVGLRAINNVVDVTNYVLLEMGQPLHAFDADKVAAAAGAAPGGAAAGGPSGVVGLQARWARAGESLLALDGRTYALAPRHLVIAAAGGGPALALAGVMGGEGSAVTAATRTVVLESAWFAPATVRRTSRELGLSSDSSYRFERGVDPGQTEAASRRAAQLLAELAGGVPRAFARAGNVPGGGLPPVRLRHGRCRRLLGAEVPDARIEEALTRFGLSRAEETPTGPSPVGAAPAPAFADGPDSGDGKVTAWRVPSFRADLTREVDLIEEVVRLVGMDAIPPRVRARFAGSSAADAEYDFAATVRRRLTGLGFAEARTMTLVADRLAAEAPFAAAGTASPPTAPTALSDALAPAAVPAAAPGLVLVRLKNPLSEEQTVLRPSLVPGLLAVAARNARVGEPDQRLFEVGRVYAAASGETIPPAAGATAVAVGPAPEPTRLGLLLTGAAAPRSWREPSPRALDLSDLRGAVEGAVGAPVEFRRVSSDRLALALEVLDAAGGTRLGDAGQVRPAQARELDLRAAVFVAELDLAAVRRLHPGQTPRFTPLPKFPSVTRDLALVVDQDLTHAAVAAALRGAGEPLLAGVALFDVFVDPSGQKIPADKKSLAYSLTYRADDRTLKTEEVAAAHERLKARLADAFPLRFRE